IKRQSPADAQIDCGIAGSFETIPSDRRRTVVARIAVVLQIRVAANRRRKETAALQRHDGRKFVSIQNRARRSVARLRIRKIPDTGKHESMADVRVAPRPFQVRLKRVLRHLCVVSSAYDGGGEIRVVIDDLREGVRTLNLEILREAFRELDET